jgi:cytochrome c553
MKKLIAVGVVLLVAGSVSLRAADAKELWDKQCAKCHGADGKGATKMGQKLGVRDYTDAKIQASFTDEQASKAIKDGVKKESETKMKAFPELTDADYPWSRISAR